VEKIDPEFDFVNLLEDHFNKTEKSFIAESADPVSAFYYLWTRKEALTKAWGTGLQDYMKQVAVLNTDSSSDLNKKKWKIKSFHISPFYPAALAYSEASKILRFFDGSSTFRNFINIEEK
jgi:4'-phosphopantetheinyl transferase